MNVKKVLLYLIFFAVMVLFFSYALFPKKEMAAKISAILEQHPNISKVDIDQATLGFGLNLRLEGIQVEWSNKRVLKSEHVLIHPGFFSIWKQNKKIYFDSSISNGRITGLINYPSDGKTPINIVSLNISGMNIDPFEYEMPPAELKISCTLDAVCAYETNIHASGQGHIEMTNMMVQVKKSLFNQLGIPDVTFSSIMIDYLQSGRQIKVTRFTAKGSEINLTIDGVINLQPLFEDSELKLSGAILPDSKKLSRFAGIKAFYNKTQHLQTKGLLFNISGTLSEPKISI